MHPILASGRRRLIYLLLWLPVAGALAALLVASAGLSAGAAVFVALEAGLLYGAIGLGTYFLCRALPLRLAQVPRVVGTHLAAAALSAALVAGLGALGLRAISALGAPTGDALRPVAILFSLGLLLFLLASALHYVLLGYQASREAERRALEFQVLSRDAELRALRAQIHPHFLFNALNSISALTGRDPAAARRVCELLGDFLRRSLTLGAAESVPLGDELLLAEALLSVERVRFGERLGVAFEVEQAARDARVPPLILQPLVENAITHGIASRIDGGQVRLAARLRDARLELRVSNPRDADAPRRRGTGLGLDNVRRRLRALYGERAEMVVEDSPESWSVTLRLPPHA